MEAPAVQQPPPSIIAVAVVQLIGSLPFLCVCGISLGGAVWVTHEVAARPILFVVLGLPFLFSLVAAISSIGLLRLHEWARITSLCLATLSLCGCVLFLIFYHPQAAYGHGTIDDPYDIGRPIAKILLAILTAVSIWWWFLFTRPSVRRRFRPG